jgi:S1-C subfamily serine protease
VIGTDGTVLTCAHVVRDADSVVVVLPDGGRYSARRMIVSETDDLAVIRIGRSMPRTLALGGPPEPAGGVAALAGPLLPAGRVRAGAVTSASCCLQRELDPAARCDYSELVESTADVQGGFSGGPMLDAEGVVVGVTVAAAGQGPTARAYAVPMTPRIRREIDRLRARLDG